MWDQDPTCTQRTEADIYLLPLMDWNSHQKNAEICEKTEMVLQTLACHMMLFTQV